MTAEGILAAYHTIVIDGCDGTGKTTLARRLAAGHGFTVVRCGRTPDHVDLAGRYRGILAADGPLVLDRCFLSELVYGPLHRHHSRISWDDAVELAAAVAGRRGVFVHLTGPPAAVHARFLARDGTAPTLRQIRGILDAFRQVFTRLAGHAPVIHRDINQVTPAAGPTVSRRRRAAVPSRRPVACPRRRRPRRESWRSERLKSTPGPTRSKRGSTPATSRWSSACSPPRSAKRSPLGAKHLPDLGEELADVAIYLMAVAEMNDIDLDSEIERKIAKNVGRV